MSKQSWVANAIEHHRHDTANLPKWTLSAYAPKPQPSPRDESQPPPKPKKETA